MWEEMPIAENLEELTSCKRRMSTLVNFSHSEIGSPNFSEEFNNMDF
jgi:hypothetical protein